MMKKIIILGILVLMSLMAAGVASAVSCGETLTSDTTLTADLGPCSGNGLNIGASNIILDCNNHSITGLDSGYGIFVNGFNNLITNCNISHFRYGIDIQSYSNNTILDNIANNNLDGITIETSSNNNLTNNIAESNSRRGIYIFQSQDNIISENYVSGNSLYGIQIRFGTNNTLISNNASSNMDIGVYIYESSANFLISNTADSNTNSDFIIQAGIDPATGNQFYSNTAGSAYPTTFSFAEYDGNVNIKGVSSPQPDPSGKLNISNYIDVSGPTWLFLNITYDEADASGVDQSTLRIYHYNSTDWEEVSGSTVDTVNNIISANLTSFSDFGGFGDPPSGGAAVPEFSDYALVLIVVTAICGFYFVKRRQK